MTDLKQVVQKERTLTLAPTLTRYNQIELLPMVFIKTKVFRAHVSSLQELKDRITQALIHLDNRPHTCKRLVEDRKEARNAARERGGHVEEYFFKKGENVFLNYQISK